MSAFNKMSLTLKIKIFILLECILLHFSLASRFPGETIPTRVEIDIGGSANITCHMNLQVFQGKNSSSLYFVEEHSDRRVPRSHIAILNETTIVYMLRNATTQNTKYVCKSGRNGIGETHVSVGTPPLDVDDFKCRGYDYLYMICNFTIPENNLLTQYSLNYTTHSLNYLHVCKLEIQGKHGICKLSKQDRNYRPNYEFYNFTLIGRNVLDTNRQHFWINHYDSVIPARPEFVVEDITTNSAVLKWRMVMFSYYGSKGFQYEVRLQPAGFDWQNHTSYEVHPNGPEYNIKLTDVPYAYTNYNVSLRIRVKTTHPDESLWSEPFMQTFQTMARRPDTPPKTDVGSFFIDPNETRVRLYWQQLPVYRQNGPNFAYVIMAKRNGANINLKPLAIDNSSATFSWEKQHYYEFEIKSRNDMGESVNSSHIIVPAWPETYKLNSPKWIRNIYHAANRTYTLSWSPPENAYNLLDYTVFWCPSKRAVLNECKGSLRFAHVSKYEQKFTTDPQQEEQEHTLNLAVSANYKDWNMGMQWTMCTADVSSDLVKLEPEISAVSARAIQLEWSPDRVCSSLLEGYNITYCRVEHNFNITPDAASCVNDNITIPVEKTAKKYILENLKPYSTYKIEMYMFSKLKVGKSSDVQLVNTKEAAPSPPRELQTNNVTSNSAWLSWFSPARLNGNLTFYTIVLKSENHIMNYTRVAPNIKNEKVSFKLEDLSSFTNYSVYITAHTVAASLHSNEVYFQTLIGIPSKPLHMTAVENNRTVMHWSKPEKPSGRVEFYEVAVKVWHRDQLQRQRISTIVGARSCVINMPLCKDADYKHTLEVRAVNLARGSEIDQQIFTANNTEEENDYEGNYDLVCIGTNQATDELRKVIQRYRNTNEYVLYKSVWEKGPFYGCAATSKFSTDTMWALGSIFISLIILTVLYLLHDKCTKMKNIKCILPSGLAEIGAYPTKGNGEHNVLGNEIADKIIEKTHIEGFHCIHDDLPFNNEHHCLLSSLCNDSGYLGDAAMGISGTINTFANSNDTVNIAPANNYISHEAFTAREQNVAAPNDAYMVMDIIKPTEKAAESPYVQQSVNMEADFSPKSISSNIGFIPTDNNYVKPNQKLTWQQTPTKSLPTTELPISNLTQTDTGYVPPDLLHKCTLNSDSLSNTTVDAMNKSNTKPTLQAPTSPMQTAATNLPISGYVTQKELSAYFQHRMS